MKACEESFAQAYILSRYKLVKCCFAYVEWCFQIFEEFVDIFYKTKASLYFNVKVMICLASFDACVLGIQKGQDINNKEKV